MIDTHDLLVRLPFGGHEWHTVSVALEYDVTDGGDGGKVFHPTVCKKCSTIHPKSRTTVELFELECWADEKDPSMELFEQL